MSMNVREAGIPVDPAGRLSRRSTLWSVYSYWVTIFASGHLWRSQFKSLTSVSNLHSNPSNASRTLRQPSDAHKPLSI